MNRRRDLALLLALALGVAVLGPAALSGTDLDRAALALSFAGAAAGAAIALAVGRPSLVHGALAGAAAYISAALAMRGVAVPIAVAAAVLASAATGAAIAVATAHLDAVALLAATLLGAVLLAALTQALPGQSGGQAGLGPVAPLSTPVPGGGILRLTATGDLHTMLVFTLLAGAGTALLLGGRAGARWRAVGSDRSRAAASGLRPLRAELLALTLAAGLSGLGGALGAHLSGAVTPGVFAPDVVALPLLAALLAGRGNALGAVLAAVATGIVGVLLLPDLGWHGPPSATATALGLLALAVVTALLPGGVRGAARAATSVVADEPWPFEPAGFAGAELAVEGLAVRAGPLLLLDGVDMHVAAAAVHGVLGPNGAGKSSLLAALAGTPRPQVRLQPPGGTVILQPQSGGGFPACSVDETLFLAARGAGMAPAAAVQTAARWRQRLGLGSAGAVLCSELPAGQRRLLDLARCLIRRPAVLLCDEPLAGLDDASRAAVEALLRTAAAAGLTVVIAEHDTITLSRLATSSTDLRRPELAALAASPAL